MAGPRGVACFAPRRLGPRGGRPGAAPPQVPEEVTRQPGCEVRGASSGPRGAVLSSRRAGWAVGARAPLSQAERRVGSGGRTGAGSCCTSRVRVFFGKLHVFSSLVSASPERGRMSHRGAHSPGLGSWEGARLTGRRGKGD